MDDGVAFSLEDRGLAKLHHSCNLRINGILISTGVFCIPVFHARPAISFFARKNLILMNSNEGIQDEIHEDHMHPLL